MIRISLEGISIAAANRPEGYEAACLSAGEIDGTDLILSDEAFAALRDSFPSFDYAKPPKPRVIPEAILQSVQIANKKTPGLLAKAVSLTKAVGSEAVAIASGAPKVNQQEADRRLRLCTNCPSCVKDNKTCSVCGCYVLSKIHFRTQHCPSGKW